jgi:hypothetical protein
MANLFCIKMPRGVAELALGFALFLPTICLAQATNSIVLQVRPQALQKQIDGSQQLDIIAELRKANPNLDAASLEIQMLEVDAKSNIGGAQIFLRINNQFVASSVIETDPDQFFTEDINSYGRFELKNIERAQINSAILQIQNSANVKLKSIQVILGAVQEPAVFGRYAQDQAEVVGGADMDNPDRDMRPTAEALAAIYGTYYGTGENVTTVQTEPTVEPVPQVQPEQQQNNSYEARNLRSAMADGFLAAQAGDLATVSSYLSQARSYYRNQKSNAFGGQILIEEEVLQYIARLERLYDDKAFATRDQENRERLAREQQERQNRQKINQSGGRPQINDSAPVQCVKTKKKKVGGKKEFCIGDFVSGVWPNYNPPQIIDIDASSKNITLLFDYTNQPLVMSVESIPDAR